MEADKNSKRFKCKYKCPKVVETFIFWTVWEIADLRLYKRNVIEA